MTQARPRVTPELSGLSRSTWERLIYEANLGAEDTELATRYFINKECQMDIAIDKELDRSTVSRHLGAAQKRITSIYKRFPS